MNRMLVVVFSQASKAFDGREALKSMDRDGSASVYALASNYQESGRQKYCQ